VTEKQSEVLSIDDVSNCSDLIRQDDERIIDELDNIQITDQTSLTRSQMAELLKDGLLGFEAAPDFIPKGKKMESQEDVLQIKLKSLKKMEENRVKENQMAYEKS